LPGVGSKPVNVSVPAPTTVRLSSTPELKLNASELADSDVPFPEYRVNGVEVPDVKEVIVMQPTQDIPAKEPVPNPILPLPMKVTELAVNVSFPSNDSIEPGVIGAADAAAVSPSNAAPAKRNCLIDLSFP